MKRKEHWEKIYATKASDSVSWFQESAETSLKLIDSTQVSKNAAIIDIGAGASRLVDDLILAGYKNLTVLDLAGSALEESKARLGESSKEVDWIEADITKAELPKQEYEVWHDRAVFHFFTEADDRSAYLGTLSRSLRPGGHVIISTFAEDGPSECSGLPVERYSAERLQAELGDSYWLRNTMHEIHETPFGSLQKFMFCHFQKCP